MKRLPNHIVLTLGSYRSQLRSVAMWRACWIWTCEGTNTICAFQLIINPEHVFSLNTFNKPLWFWQHCSILCLFLYLFHPCAIARFYSASYIYNYWDNACQSLEMWLGLHCLWYCYNREGPSLYSFIIQYDQWYRVGILYNWVWHSLLFTCN